jgi:hypothetical protein
VCWASWLVVSKVIWKRFRKKTGLIGELIKIVTEWTAEPSNTSAEETVARLFGCMLSARKCQLNPDQAMLHNLRVVSCEMSHALMNCVSKEVEYSTASSLIVEGWVIHVLFRTVFGTLAVYVHKEVHEYEYSNTYEYLYLILYSYSSSTVRSSHPYVFFSYFNMVTLQYS